VGFGLKDSLASGKIKRGELFITTKLWCTYHTRVEENLDLSLQRLGLDYVDLYLMHWPIAMNPNGQSSFLLPVIVFHEPLTYLCRQPPELSYTTGRIPRSH
jgi:diketogulonate reductase-like aldo/keto reductase